MWTYTRQILEGLNHIHKMGLVHRDIKPSNILIGLNGDLKIADFGLVQFSTININYVKSFNDLDPTTKIDQFMNFNLTTEVGTQM